MMANKQVAGAKGPQQPKINIFALLPTIPDSERQAVRERILEAITKDMNPQ
jgi:hypothetical protein